MEENQLATILGSVARRMRADFEQSAAFQHRGESGTAREKIVRDFLSGYLPGNVEALHNGEIISVDGVISPQCDVIVMDGSTPPFTNLGGYRIIPNECVYGVMEVKTRLNREQLFDACEKIRRVRALPKSAYRKVPDPISRTTRAYGKTFSHYPTAGIIFAFDSVDLVTLGEHLREWCAGKESQDLPDSIWVLGKGFLQWVSPVNGNIDRGPTPGAELALFDVDPIIDVLFPLALHLNIHFAEAWMEPLNLIPYARRVGFGTFRKKWTVGQG